MTLARSSDPVVAGPRRPRAYRSPALRQPMVGRVALVPLAVDAAVGAAWHMASSLISTRWSRWQ
jgi:hypothetical protein